MIASPPAIAVELPEWLERFVDIHRELFFLYTQNSIWHLAIAVVFFIALFLGRLTFATRTLARARADLPLVIGGWGTRGKSGTERKKAALFHAVGAEVFCKTTGCEAMFIHSVPGSRPRELFIYRPYDKATIWEQRDVVMLARDLKPHVFLYECMALNPAYVRLIQEGWMHDDLSTITNTYPDHEDIQGPAGIDIPYVMNHFIPNGKVCFTCEDMMVPVLREAARRKGAELVQVRWRDGDLIAEDVLDRYPYKVHPMNLALVTRLAEHLGIERDFTLKEIADWIVPDLGVLKVFPIGRWRGRRIEFSNGHSANERRGYNANWIRLGLHEIDPVKTPGRWLVTVINNRADRVARSKVFADAMVKDQRVHKHFCIGTNLTGLRGYVLAALETRVANVTLLRPEAATAGVSAGALRAEAEADLEKELHDLMWETPTFESVGAQLEAMLAGLGVAADRARAIARDPDLTAAATASAIRDPAIEVVDPAGAGVAARAAAPAAAGSRRGDPRLDERLEAASAAIAAELEALGAAVRLDAPAREIADECVRFYRKYLAAWKSVDAFRGYVRSALEGGAPPSQARRDDLNARLRSLVRKMFAEKIEIQMDALASGDRTVDFIARRVPPGFHVHVHGAQNIKGTGLDWVYRWISLDQVTEYVQKLEDDRAWARSDAVLALSSHTDYGVMDAKVALEALERVRRLPQNQEINFQSRLNLAVAHVQKKGKASIEALAQKEPERGPFARALGEAFGYACGVLEMLLEAGDSKRRRRASETIVRDLVDQRISHERAALELRNLMKRQKGGWLRRAIETRAKRFAEAVGGGAGGAGSGERA